MAAVAVVEETEEARKSLLDVVIEEYNQEADQRTSRLLLTGEVADHVRDAEKTAAEFHNSFMAKQDKSKKITGCALLLNNETVVHLLEGPTTVLFDLLRSLKEDAASNILKNGRIISLTEEVPREFPVWSFRAISDFPKIEFAAPKVWLQETFETLKQFLELGRELSGMAEDKALEYLQSSTARPFLSRFPSSDKIKGFQKCEELCSVEDYLAIYDTPVEFVLEGELIWPVEPFLKY